MKNKAKIAVLTLAILAGVAVGLGSFTFVYARGGSYLSNNPEACANCHIMGANYDAWAKSSHHAVAGCNDCHAPHDSVIGKLFVKGVNGWNHSLAFTTGRFHEPIQITSMNREVTESACRYCHKPIIEAIDAQPREGEALSCIRCHPDVGHP